MSRYAHSKTLERRDAAGRPVRYLAPRILPLGETVAGPHSTTVGADERHRLDLVANRTLGDPGSAYLIADANDAIDPFELTARAGHSLRLPGGTL